VNSFTPNAGNSAGAYTVSYTDTTIWVPQRLNIILGGTSAVDPVSGNWDFYLSASANTVAMTFTEAALYYQSNSKAMSHVSFAYVKATNSDLRLSYVLTRTST
jgi:acetyl-CoA carboxylase carboxyltransferase component